MFGHDRRLSRFGYLINLLVGWLLDFGVVSVGTIFSKVAKFQVLTSKTWSVVIGVLICCWLMSNFRLSLVRQEL